MYDSKKRGTNFSPMTAVRPWKQSKSTSSRADVKSKLDQVRSIRLERDAHTKVMSSEKTISFQIAKDLQRTRNAELGAERKAVNEKKRLAIQSRKERQVKHAVEQKSASIIQNTTKLKKWKAKARQQLVRMPPEYAAHKYGIKVVRMERR